MTRQKTITSISIAAIALLAAAVPSVTQAQSTGETQSPVATQTVEQTIASNMETIAVAKTRVAPAVKAEPERTAVNGAPQKATLPKLSASAFKMPSGHFASQSLDFNNAGPSDPTAKKQFRVGDDDSSKGRKAVTFVPSRGQQLPE